ncbi:CAP domain-containing protein [Longimicrobium sp.]|uniref:CAP domain-containing protein n=1 Tax=Longimicrobium sp. TaxID=2029185 RepID=UPI002E358036|nr:CAP domain-containing protein [Longimicrobium sp.]HEX6040411.1 CAP domain-containing protein [Longimicrobium sp.]
MYQNVPQRVPYTAAQMRWADSVSALREAEFAAILTGAREQRRPALRRNPVLDSVARARAWDMALRGYFAHVTPEGIGPNTLVEHAGYALPPAYEHALSGNNIESAAGGYASARTAWSYFMGSTHHRTHLLGLNPIFAAQTEFGIGYAWRPNSRYGHYWVVLIAQPAETDSTRGN